MISIKQINEKDIDLCYELDSNTPPKMSNIYSKNKQKKTNNEPN